jgi:hypothetical protein
MSEKQGTLFDPANPPVLRPTDPNVRPHDVPRLSRQCRLILERLRQGRASNVELAGIALKYTGRISDLRQHGYNVVCVVDEGNGVNWYELR